jgi:hypothetical protein
MKKDKNLILLEKLKDKYPDINISKPVYPEGYWDETFKILRDTENGIKKEIKLNEPNNTSKKKL